MISKPIRLISAVLLFGTLLACGTEDLTGSIFQPSIAAISPDNGHVGDTVTISGAFLSHNGSPYTVTFNGVTASSVSVISDAQISVQVPLGATTGPVVVTNPNGGDPLISNSETFTVL